MRMRGHYFTAFWERTRHLTVFRKHTPDAKEGDGF
jgi:hypothetical protein